MLYNEDPLSWWYPGFGEVQIVNRLHPDLRRFLADAIADDPTFLHEYLTPVLESSDPEQELLGDLADVFTELEFEEVLGLGDLDVLTDSDLEEIGLGDLGKLKKIRKKLKKKLKKVVKSAAKDFGQAVKRVAKSSTGQAIAAPFTMGMSVKGVREGIKKGMTSKYAAPVISVVGAVAAPFTGGASMAAAAVLLAANQMYQAKKAAKAAKSMAKADAAEQVQAAQQAETETSAQVDQFYTQNQSWFEARGIDQVKWNSMTLDQKIATIDAAAKGQLQVVQPSPQVSMPALQQEAPGGVVPGGAYPSGGGSAPTAGGGGGGGGGFSPGGGFAPMETAAGPKVAQAGLFGGPLLPIMAAGALVYILFGQKGHGRRKTRRNPSRGSRRWITAA